jgi:pilus assembly protein CpaE
MRNPQIIIVSPDRSLEAEFQAALSGLQRYGAITFSARDMKDVTAAARNRQPQLVCIELDDDPRALAAATREIHLVAPEALVAAAFQPRLLEADTLDTAVIIELLRARVQDFLRRPISSTELRGLLDRLVEPSQSPATAPAGRVVSFISNKGGVGKSTLAVNVACALAERSPGRILLVDASLQLGVCALMLDLRPQTTIVDAVRERDRLDQSLLRRLSVPHDCGLRLLAAPVDAVEAAEVDEESMASILNIARHTFDVTVVDTFPLIDNLVMTILDQSDLVFVTLQATAPTVAGAAKLLPVLEGLHLPAERQRLVLNQTYKSFVGGLTVADVESRLSRQIDHTVPYQRKLVPAMNIGEPYILRAPRWFGFGRAMTRIVDDIVVRSSSVPEATAPVVDVDLSPEGV